MQIATKPQPDPAIIADGETLSVRALTVAQLAERYSCKPHVILALIRASELKALDIRAPGAKRPHWRIMPQDLEAFERRRAAVPSEPPSPRSKKRSGGIDLVDPATGRVRREYRRAGSVQAAKKPGK